MNPIYLLVILRFGGGQPFIEPIEFTTLKACETARTELVAAGVRAGFMERALVAACVRQS
jgi:hypothetical protein